MIAKIKGTQDILPAEAARWQELESIIANVSTVYHFQEIRTPMFEASELFHRGVGEATDIVKKETYDFSDRGDRMITLRPEGTAGVVRAVIENKLYTDPSLPLKYYYVGPMFRYERPQKGRQRQFHQFGAEALVHIRRPPIRDDRLRRTTLRARAAQRQGQDQLLGAQESKLAYRSGSSLPRTQHAGAVSGLPEPYRKIRFGPDCKFDRENPIPCRRPSR